MMYEIKKQRLTAKEAICVFCKKPVSWGDYAYLCKEHGDKYYKIYKIFRVILPKFIIRRFV